jgi:hypothetical protein
VKLLDNQKKCPLCRTEFPNSYKPVFNKEHEEMRKKEAVAKLGAEY